MVNYFFHNLAYLTRLAMLACVTDFWLHLLFEFCVDHVGLFADVVFDFKG